MKIALAGLGAKLASLFKSTGMSSISLMDMMQMAEKGASALSKKGEDGKTKEPENFLQEWFTRRNQSHLYQLIGLTDQEVQETIFAILATLGDRDKRDKGMRVISYHLLILLFHVKVKEVLVKTPLPKGKTKEERSEDDPKFTRLDPRVQALKQTHEWIQKKVAGGKMQEDAIEEYITLLEKSGFLSAKGIWGMLEDMKKQALQVLESIDEPLSEGAMRFALGENTVNEFINRYGSYEAARPDLESRVRTQYNKKTLEVEYRNARSFSKKTSMIFKITAIAIGIILFVLALN